MGGQMNHQTLEPAISDRDLGNPNELYDRLRQSGPVTRMPGSDYFVVTEYDLIRDIAMDTDTYSSNLVAIVMATTQGSTELLQKPELDFGPVDVLAIQDPPAHTRQRKLTNGAFAFRPVRNLSERIRELADSLIGQFGQDPDWMVDFAFKLPTSVILEVLGLPADDRDRVKTWSDHSVALLSGVNTPESMATHMQQSLAFFLYIQEQFNQAVEEPGDNLIGQIVAGTQQPGGLTADEAMSIILQLVVAGNESTASLIGSAGLVLARDPELQQRIRHDRDLLDPFIEEVLRLESPFQGHFRVTTRDTTLGDVELEKGTRLMLVWGAANRDPSQFDRPGELDLARPNAKSHVAFGYGIHHCIGAPLARLEARISLSALLDREREFSLVDDAVDYLPSLFIRTPARLPIRFC